MIALLYGVFIGIEDVLASGESRDKHQKRAFGSVEVGQHLIHDPELESGSDEEVRCRALGLQETCIAVDRALEGPDTCCADGNDLPALFPGPVDLICNFFGYMIAFGMHHMILEVLGSHRQEGSHSDMKRDVKHFHSLLLELIDHLGCEMEARSRTCHRAALVGENGLVTLLVIEIVFTLDIGRKRHMAAFLEEILVDLSVEFHDLQRGSCVMVIHIRVDGCPAEKFSFGSEKLVPLAGSLLLALGDHCLPSVGSDSSSKEELDLASGLGNTENTGLSDTCVIDDNDGTFLNQ